MSASKNRPKPPSLVELTILIQACRKERPSPAECTKITAALEYLHDFLQDRQLYHKKHAVKNRMLVKAAKQFLDADELQALGLQAEREAGDV